MNLQSSTARGNGTHWCLLYNARNDSVIYFDPVGYWPPTALANRMLSTHKRCVVNHFQEQPINSMECGQFCAAVANRLLQGESFHAILTKFFNDRQIDGNDKLVRYIVPHV